MHKIVIILLFFLLQFCMVAHPAMALTSKSIVRLKKAGVSDKTIQLIVKTKVIETAAFSVEDIVNMKKAGLGDQTLRMLIKESSFLKNTKPIVYGETTRSIRFTTAQDVIELKKAGLSDEVIQSVIAASGERYYSQHEEALDILRDMFIRVDLRDEGEFQEPK